MKASYQGNAKPFVLALYHPANESAVRTILESLDALGLTLCYREDKPHKRSVIRRASAVIAFLSLSAVADDSFRNALLAAKAENVPLVCVNLDDTLLDDSIRFALYAQNIIYATRYPEPSVLTERIMSAEALRSPALTLPQKKASKRLALAMIIGALLVIAAAGLFFWQQAEAPVAVEEAAPDQVVDIAGMLGSGMTEEDLQSIRTLILVGDVSLNPAGIPSYRDWREYVLDMEMDGETIWTMEGQEIPRGTVMDISLIGRMTNLQSLILVHQSVTDLSPLSKLEKLRYLEIVDCPAVNIEAIGEIKGLLQLTLQGMNVSDLTPLQNCTTLMRFFGTLEHCRSLDGLSAPSLLELFMESARELRDISALSACTNLTTLRLSDAPHLSDISALASCGKLQSIHIDGAKDLRDCSALAGKTMLTEVSLHSVGIRDLSPLRDSRALSRLMLSDMPISDLSWTSGSRNLRVVGLQSTNMRSFDFLNEIDVKTMELHFSDSFTDYSGLAAISRYSYMHLNPNNGNLAAVLPHIADAKIDHLNLYDCYGVDCSALPKGVIKLEITNSNMTTLEGLSLLPNLQRVVLENLSRLTSLAGLAECSTLAELQIIDCFRLMDITDLYVLRLPALELKGMLTVPDLAKLQFSDNGQLTLNNIQGLTDLSPLVDAGGSLKELKLHNTDEIVNIMPLRSLYLERLEVPPQLAEQAEQLKDEGCIENYLVVYPDDELWMDGDREFTLLSLDEMDTLPNAVLKRVRSLALVGDHLVDQNTEYWRDEWDGNGNQSWYIVKQTTDESTRVGAGTFEAMERLAALTGMENLILIEQPLTTLQGIQTLQNLRYLEISHCQLRDTSAAFTLTQLEGLSFCNTPTDSIQGIQNLSKLYLLNIGGTQVSNISPLADCDWSAAYDAGGFDLQIWSVPCEDFGALASILHYAYLNICDVDAAFWLNALVQSEVKCLNAENCNLTDRQIVTIAALTGLNELSLSWNQNITDLTPLLSSGTLEKLTLSRDMTEALASIEGRTDFEILLVG